MLDCTRLDFSMHLIPYGGLLSDNENDDFICKDMDFQWDVAASDETVFKYLSSLNMSHIKNYDYYLILGLNHLRYKATTTDIRKAYKKSVMLFHPDRKNSKFKLTDSQFVFITKAFEVLTDPTKRHCYDSIDDSFEEKIPIVVEPEDFYKVFHPIILNNSRWSSHQPVPMLGDESSSYEQLSKFYSFWKAFQTSRDFSMLIDEPVESCENRDERRYILKMNKKKIAELRKKELDRIQNIVDQCKKYDPRIPILRKQKEEAEKAKKFKQTELKLNQQRQALENQRILKEKAILAEKQRLIDEQEKLLKKNQKNMQKKMHEDEKNILRHIVSENNFFIKLIPNDSKYSSIKLQSIAALDKFLRSTSYDKLKEFNEKLGNANLTKDQKFIIYHQAVFDKVPSEEVVEEPQNIKNEAIKASTAVKQWSKEENTILMTAQKIYPVGTKNRYSILTDYLNNHQSRIFSEKEVITKMKSLNFNNEQSRKPAVKVEAVKPQPQLEKNLPTQERIIDWNNEEHKKFQEALKIFPIGTENRWLKIAKLFPNKTEDDCKERMKHLLELLKKRKNM